MMRGLWGRSSDRHGVGVQASHEHKCLLLYSKLNHINPAASDPGASMEDSTTTPQVAACNSPLRSRNVLFRAAIGNGWGTDPERVVFPGKCFSVHTFVSVCSGLSVAS
eukprot:1936782-Rhodomonas_salina.1